MREFGRPGRGRACCGMCGWPVDYTTIDYTSVQSLPVFCSRLKTHLFSRRRINNVNSNNSVSVSQT